MEIIHIAFSKNNTFKTSDHSYIDNAHQKYILFVFVFSIIKFHGTTEIYKYIRKATIYNTSSIN